MALVLSDGERIIKSWDYSKQQDSNKSIVKNVTVTNKRIICSSQNAQFVTRSETSIANVQSVSSGYSLTKSNKTLYLILALLTAVLTVACAVAAVVSKMYFIIVGGVVFLALSVFFFYKMSKEKKTASFYLYIRTGGYSEETINIGEITYNKSGKAVNSETSEVLRVEVDEVVSKEIVDTIGALLLR